MALKLASLVAFIVLVIAILMLMARKSLFGDGFVAIAIQIGAVLIMLWARLTFSLRSFHAVANPTKGKLVTTGPYGFLRHPIYASALYFIWAGAISHFSVSNCLLVLLASAAVAVRIATEERLLFESYPEYVAYAARTKRIIPFVF